MKVEYKTKNILVRPWNTSNSEYESHWQSNSRAMSSIQKRYVDIDKSSSATKMVYRQGESTTGATGIVQNVGNRYSYLYPTETKQSCNYQNMPDSRFLKSELSNDSLNLDVKLPTRTSICTCDDNYNERHTHQYSYGSFPEMTMDYCDPLIDYSKEVPGATYSDSSSCSCTYDCKAHTYDEEEFLDNCSKFVESKDHCKNDIYSSNRMQKCDLLKPSSSGLNVGALASYESRFKNKNASEKINAVGAVRYKMIEISPGEYMRLRGAQETWKAIQDDFYIPCSCICCELTLFCIQDATYVLCPMCQVVSSLEQIDGYDGGVGLGFTMDELAQWQNEILQERQY